MAASIRKRKCYFATLIIVEFARVSRLIERDFSRVGGEFMDPFLSETSHFASRRQEDTDNVAIDKEKCNDERGGDVSRAMLIKRIIFVTSKRRERIENKRKASWGTLTHHQKLIYGWGQQSRWSNCSFFILTFWILPIHCSE